MKQIISYILASPLLYIITSFIFEKVVKRFKIDVHPYASLAVPGGIVLSGLALIILFI